MQSFDEEVYQDAEAISVVATGVESLREISRAARKRSDEQVSGEEVECVRVEYTQNSRYADPVESVPVVTIEEILTVSSRDSLNVQAAKQCLNELLSRQNRSHCSNMKYTVSTGSGVDRSAPSLADFVADVTLCGKRSLPRFQYQVFCWAIDNGFDGWHRVPEVVRKNIFENTGAELLRRKIWDGRSTRKYWENTFKKYGRPRTVAASFRLT